MKKIVKNLIIALFTFVVLGILINGNFVKDKYVLNNWNQKVPDQILLDKPSTCVYVTEFGDTNFDTLVIPKVIGNLFRVYLNGEEIYSYGTKTGNIWSYAYVVPLKNLSSNKNILKIEIFGLYDAGLPRFPFLTDRINALRYQNFQNFLRHDFYIISIGISFVAGIISFFLGYLLKAKQISHSYDLFGLFLILTAIALFDYQVRTFHFNEITFLIFKKIFLISAYFSSLFYIAALEKYKLKRFRTKWLIWYVIFASIFPIFSFNLNDYAKFSTVSNMLMLVVLFYVIFDVLYLKIDKLYFATFFIVFSYIHIILYFLYVRSYHFQEFLTGYGSAFLSISVILMLTDEFEKVLVETNEISNSRYIDPLTKAYNRNILEKLDNSNIEGFFVLIDLNDFKKLNDKFGHDKGDKVLVEFSKLIRENIREEDLFIRLGGDEFALIVNLDDPESFVERLRKLLIKIINLDFSYGIVKFSNFSESYRLADKLLYDMKSRNKNK
ncbi:diguanylate cyclase (GGDEF)-like protein [Thermosipho japonicus]|uniref:Diguanylate cyclase (GGDEF)-like protein n=1 Tax=Thermosipho japonicus TaxID=90323 RepID=A0A841GS05_9BACT|nr:GGDEF domain-containing protein [Thermosipho japonicus]MBB6062723.1 diguanylate cyclase (GGDEF)-like protein [Thermosipho japonicus]